MIESKDLLLKFIYSILVLLSLCVLVGCAGKKPVVEPAAMADSNATVEAPRDSLRAKFLLTIVQRDTVTGNASATVWNLRAL